MNVDTRHGIFGKYLRTTYPDGSVTLSDQAKGQHIDIKAENIPMDLAAVEALFAAKYAPAMINPGQVPTFPTDTGPETYRV